MSFLNSKGNPEIKSKIERFCAFQERSPQEVRSKLISWGLPDEEISRLIADLIDLKFLDESRFVASYVSGKFRIKKWGKIKIRTHLNYKGISKDLIDNALKVIGPEEYVDTLNKLAMKKYGELLKEKDRWTKKAKLQRFLASKGYEMDLIMDAIQLLDQ
jgi:regulatory protein